MSYQPFDFIDDIKWGVSLSPVPGKTDLRKFIVQSECVNADSSQLAKILGDGGELASSNNNPQLIIRLQFSQPVKVHTVLLRGSELRSPKKVKVFINNPVQLDLSSASLARADQQLDFNAKEPHTRQLSSALYETEANSIQFFITNNTRGSKKTVVEKLQLYGEACPNPIPATKAAALPSHPVSRLSRDETTVATTTAALPSPAMATATIPSPIAHLHCDAEVTDLLQTTGTVVIASFTTGCGACTEIEPVFEELASTGGDLEFAVVHVDQCLEWAERRAIIHTPTFMVYHDGIFYSPWVIGANKPALTNVVNKLLKTEVRTAPLVGSASKTLLHPITRLPMPPMQQRLHRMDVAGQHNLAEYIDIDRSRCVGAVEYYPLRKMLDGDWPVCSADERLIISLEFSQPVCIHSVLVRGPAMVAPNSAKLFTNNSVPLDFASCTSTTAAQRLKFGSDISKGCLRQLKSASFKGVHSVTFFFEDNQSGKGQTMVEDLLLYGAPVTADEAAELVVTKVEGMEHPHESNSIGGDAHTATPTTTAADPLFVTPMSSTTTGVPTPQASAAAAAPVADLQSGAEANALLWNYDGSNLPVMVYFYSTGCGVCESIAPTFYELAASGVANLIFAKADLEKCAFFASRKGVKAAPTFSVFIKHESKEHLVKPSKAELEEFIADWSFELPTPEAHIDEAEGSDTAREKKGVRSPRKDAAPTTAPSLQRSHSAALPALGNRAPTSQSTAHIIRTLRNEKKEMSATNSELWMNLSKANKDVAALKKAHGFIQCRQVLMEKIEGADGWMEKYGLNTMETNDENNPGEKRKLHRQEKAYLLYMLDDGVRESALGIGKVRDAVKWAETEGKNEQELQGARAFSQLYNNVSSWLSEKKVHELIPVIEDKPMKVFIPHTFGVRTYAADGRFNEAKDSDVKELMKGMCSLSRETDKCKYDKIEIEYLH